MASSSKYIPLRPRTSISSDGSSRRDIDDDAVPWAEKLANDLGPTKLGRWLVLPTVLLVLTNTFWALALLALFFREPAEPTAMHPEPRFATDLPDVQPAVQYVQRTFSQPLLYNETSGLVERIVDSDAARYFGEPSPEVDANWNALLRGTDPPGSMTWQYMEC